MHPHSSLGTTEILLKLESVRQCLCPAQNPLIAPVSLRIKSRALTTPCRNWPPLEPLSSSLPRFLSFSYNMPGRFLPPGICPCNSLCWGRSFPNLHGSLPSCHSSFSLNLTSKRTPGYSISRGAALHWYPSTAVLFCDAFLTTQRHVTHLLLVFPLEYQFDEKKDLVCFVHCCVPSHTLKNIFTSC